MYPRHTRPQEAYCPRQLMLRYWLMANLQNGLNFPLYQRQITVMCEQPLIKKPMEEVFEKRTEELSMSI